MKRPQLATFRLPLAIGTIGAGAPLLMGASAVIDPAAAANVAALSSGFVMTGNQFIDGLIVAAVAGPLAGLAAWLIKTLGGVAIVTAVAMIEAYADAVEAKARRTPSKADDDVSGAFAKALRAGAARLKKADKSGEE